MRRILVTGSAGAVGNYVVQKLLEKGYKVRGVDIRPTPTEDLKGLPLEKLEIITGDLTTREFAGSVAAGADAVIHTAGITNISLGYKELAQVNIMSVRHLYEAAKNSGTQVFIHLSSCSVYSPEVSIATEDTPIRAKNGYEQTKVESENLIRTLGKDDTVRYIILRSGLVYGPRGRFLASSFSTLPAILGYFFGRRTPAFDGGPRTNLVHAEDVARAAVFLMQTPNSWGREYNIAGKIHLSFGEIITANVEAYGLETAYVVRLPSPSFIRPFKPVFDSNLLYRIMDVLISHGWDSIVERHEIEPYLRPRLSKELAPFMFYEVMFSMERLSELGFHLKHEDYHKSIRDIVRWYIRHNWLPDYDEIRHDSGLKHRIGFTFSERMVGSYRFTSLEAAGSEQYTSGYDGKGNAMEFGIDAKVSRIEGFMSNPVAGIEGNLYMEGFADGVRLEGTLSMPLLTERKIIYDFTFKANDGKRYRCSGEKNISPLSPIQTFTQLPCIITDENGEEVARSLVRFNLRRDIMSFIRSFGLNRCTDVSQPSD